METDIMQRIKQWKYKQDLPTQKREGEGEEGERETESQQQRHRETDRGIKEKWNKKGLLPLFYRWENQ